MIALPKLRHPFCEKYRCVECLADIIALQRYFEDRIGDRKYTDWLGSYRLWLDKKEDKGWDAETNHGYPHPNCFEPAYADAFILEHLS